jgi:hypothetical protein
MSNKFQKVEKCVNSCVKDKLIEKMASINNEVDIILSNVDINTPSGVQSGIEIDIMSGIMSASIPMCTIQTTDTCPVGFMKSTFCMGQNNTDVNTNICVQNYNTPSN